MNIDAYLSSQPSLQKDVQALLNLNSAQQCAPFRWIGRFPMEDVASAIENVRRERELLCSTLDEVRSESPLARYHVKRLMERHQLSDMNPPAFAIGQQINALLHIQLILQRDLTKLQGSVVFSDSEASMLCPDNQRLLHYQLLFYRFLTEGVSHALLEQAAAFSPKIQLREEEAQLEQCVEELFQSITREEAKQTEDLLKQFRQNVRAPLSSKTPQQIQVLLQTAKTAFEKVSQTHKAAIQNMCELFLQTKDVDRYKEKLLQKDEKKAKKKSEKAKKALEDEMSVALSGTFADPEMTNEEKQFRFGIPLDERLNALDAKKLLLENEFVSHTNTLDEQIRMLNRLKAHIDILSEWLRDHAHTSESMDLT